MRGESSRTDLIADEVVAASALKKFPQLYDKVVDCRMVSSLYSRKAYILEKSMANTWINVYVWLGTSWHLQTTYQAVEHGPTRVCSLRATVIDLLLSIGVTNDTLLVMEQNDVLWCWHTYRLKDNIWQYITSSEALLNRSAVINN
jgi:hypothetical protein